MLSLVHLLAGCVGAAGAPPAASSTAGLPTADTRPENAAPAPTSGLPRRAESPAASPGPADALVAQAMEDAAGRAGTPAEAVKIVQVDAREWPDRSLGCPQPGMGYAQSITPGYLIVLEVQGRHFQYHTDHAQVVYCDAPL
jgi:hypothetical protein